MRKILPLFSTKDLNPLSKSLLEAFGKDKRGRGRRRWDKNAQPSYNRTDIIDEKACDDIIEYLAPTLEQHKGCSIIDVHPGACLFSSKIHDYLKPKRHLLMEPEERYLEPYIQPLLDKRNSTYRYTSLTGAHPKSYFQSYEKVLDDPSLLPRPGLPAGDPKLRRLDPSLLVIGNLDRSYDVQKRLDLASLLMHQMPYAALANQLFQRSGLVRMLWWIPERMKHHTLPRGTYIRSSFSSGIEMGTKIREVAGTASVNDIQNASSVSRKRADLFDQLNAQQVAQRMKDNGMSVPKDRQLLRAATGDLIPKEAHKSPFEDKVVSTADFEAKINKARERLKEIVRVTSLKTSQTRRQNMLELNQTVEYPQCQAVVDSYHETVVLSKMRGPILLDLQLQVINLEANYKALEETNPSNASLNHLKRSILNLDAEILAVAATFGAHQSGAISVLNEEQISFYMTPQHLPLDRRPFEPLKLSPSDFFPPTSKLALLDLIPKSRDLSVPDLAASKEAVDICSVMLRQIYSAKTKSVIDALDTFAINAGQDLVPMVPAIYDVRKGGRLDPRNVSVRMLTEEMIEGLVKAFFEWPFRPRTWEITGGTDHVGSGIDDSAEEEQGSDGEFEAESQAVNGTRD